MKPACDSRTVGYVGDSIEFELGFDPGLERKGNWSAFLRTNLGRAARLRSETIRTFSKPGPGGFWRDVPMHRTDSGWIVRLALGEVGYFESKAFVVDPEGRQHWPQGANTGTAVHPDSIRTANTIYCAFTRLFGPSKNLSKTQNPEVESQARALDTLGYTVIPPSGTMRDLKRELPHIFKALRCRTLHLLPINPTPTTSARFGRFGSPYACKDLTAIDPALMEFDKKTTAVDQFIELADAVHELEGKLLLDIVINHTGWNSTLHEEHPEWFVREPDGQFASPGAWGTVWEDLVELDTASHALWHELSEALLTWCRRGVDGFRCDAGYKVPAPVWRYIVARVRNEFPNTVFLLEGLGGGWDDTETLLTLGGMQWAYSELFQEFSGVQVAGYLSHCLKQSTRVGTLVHYSETHDNNRLASKGREWSLLRNRLSALSSLNGAFGFTCGVEWLAKEKILVHQCGGLSWGSPENIIEELAQLNQLLIDHPCFFDTSCVTRFSPDNSSVLALRRESPDGQNTVYVFANLDAECSQTLEVSCADMRMAGPDSVFPACHLIEASPGFKYRRGKGSIELQFEPGDVVCLATSTEVQGLTGPSYRRARAQAAAAIQALSIVAEPERIGRFDWQELAGLVDRDPLSFLGKVATLEGSAGDSDFMEALRAIPGSSAYAPVVKWTTEEATRVTLVPHRHWLLLSDPNPFRASLQTRSRSIRMESIPTLRGFVVFVPPVSEEEEGAVLLEIHRFLPETARHAAKLLFLGARAAVHSRLTANYGEALVLLTNGIGGMARVPVDLGAIRSKYDCVLGANLHASVPVDRHVFVKRLRLWVMARNHLTQLNAGNLVSFRSQSVAEWVFHAHAGDGFVTPIRLRAQMIQGRNSTRFEVSIPPQAEGPANRTHSGPVSIVCRFEIEDRNFHSQTQHNDGSERHFASFTHSLPGGLGFEFTPAADRQLRVFCDRGRYHVQPEWCDRIPHPVESTRGQEPSGDAYSPGWFECPLEIDRPVAFTATAELGGRWDEPQTPMPVRAEGRDDFESILRVAIDAFVVRRDAGKTVIAGYPWFLDWGRDTFIAARGLITAGMHEPVLQILRTFGKFVDRGTLPNNIHGEDASNRDTSDAPLWYGVVCEELALATGCDAQEGSAKKAPYSAPIDARGRTVADVLREIARGIIDGTPNGIRMDPDSGLVWSPTHFTWMDTNFPAGTPREGYPVEIQALWIRLLRLLARLRLDPVERPWAEIAEMAERSVSAYYWLEDAGYFADHLAAKPGQPARLSHADDALRPNCLFLVSLGLVSGERARRTVDAAARFLVVPGAVRSLAPRPVLMPLPIRTSGGALLNNPTSPYWGRYEGDEDTSRKPAYHNGTAWVWPFPTFCEALACAYEFAPRAVAAAQSYLGSASVLLMEGCVGHLPEILDGDVPHTQRGCDAQAWSATETLRVFKLLEDRNRDQGVALG